MREGMDSDRRLEFALLIETFSLLPDEPLSSDRVFAGAVLLRRVTGSSGSTRAPERIVACLTT